MEDTNRGSIWRKWDLHIHTPASYLNGYSDNWNDYVDDVIEKSALHGVEAFATADYFTIDGYEKLLKYYDPSVQVLASKNTPEISRKVCIIPGVELRVKVFNGEGDSINLHILFDPKASPAFIRQNFLEELKFSYQGHSLKLAKNNLFAVGKSILENSELDISASFEGVSDIALSSYLKAAYSTITLEKHDIKTAIEEVNKVLESHGKKSAFVAVAVKGHGGIDSLDWFDKSGSMSRAGLTREDFSADADVFFSCSKDDADFYIGKNPGADIEEIERRFKRLKPCIWGSDAHNKDKLFHPSNGATRKYTWIKGDASFDGLKQIIYEPVHRIKVQENNPYEDYLKPYFSNISIQTGSILDGKKPKFSNINLDLNRDMIAIIGGRGSGKSLMIDVLASAFGKELGGDTDRLRKINKALDFKVVYKKSDDESTVYELYKDNNLDYLHVHQGQVKNIVTDHARLDKEIKKLLGIKTDDDEIILDERIETDVSRIENIITFFEQTNENGVRTNTVEYQKTRKKKYEELIETITTSENKEKINAYRLNSFKIELLEEKKSDFEEFQRLLSDSEEDYKERVEQVNTITFDVVDEVDVLIASIGEDARLVMDEGVFSVENMELDGEQQEMLNELNNSDASMKYAVVTQVHAMFPKVPEVNYQKQRAVVATNLELLNAERQYLKTANDKIKQEFIDSGIKGDIGKLFDSVSQYQSSITTLDKNIATIGLRNLELSKLIDRLCIRADEINLQLVNLRSEIDQKWQSVKEPVDQTEEQKSLTRKLLEDIEVFGEISFDRDAFYSVLLEALNLSRFRPQAGKKVIDKLEEVFGVKDIDTFVKLISCQKVISIEGKKCTIGDFLSMKDYFTIKGRESLLRAIYMDTGFSDFITVVSKSKYLGKEPTNLSVGQRGTFYVCLKLATDSFSTPLIFDQPDDDLDSDFIVRKLVPIFKEIKNYRQVIIITHNANFVVNTDVEQVIVAKNANEVLSYTSGGIENGTIREQVYGILEGGKKAFLNREEKYGF